MRNEKAEWEDKFYVSVERLKDACACRHSIQTISGMISGGDSAQVLVNKQTLGIFVRNYGVFPYGWLRLNMPLLINHPEIHKLYWNQKFNTAAEFQRGVMFMEFYYKLWREDQSNGRQS